MLLSFMSQILVQEHDDTPQLIVQEHDDTPQLIVQEHDEAPKKARRRRTIEMEEPREYTVEYVESEADYVESDNNSVGVEESPVKTTNDGFLKRILVNEDTLKMIIPVKRKGLESKVNCVFHYKDGLFYVDFCDKVPQIIGDHFYTPTKLFYRIVKLLGTNYTVSNKKVWDFTYVIRGSSYITLNTLKHNM